VASERHFKLCGLRIFQRRISVSQKVAPQSFYDIFIHGEPV